MLQIRNASIDDYNRIMAIYRIAQDFMIESGNPNQWAHAYPGAEIIKQDIHDGVCKVIYDESGLHGVFTLLEGEEPTYECIEDGEWLNDEPYVTIHRLASDGEVHGVFKRVSDYCKKRSRNVRADTHADNKIMQKQIEKNDYIECGIIYVADGSPRIAYHWKGSRGVI